jgi:hypothetical protein
MTVLGNSLRNVWLNGRRRYFPGSINLRSLLKSGFPPERKDTYHDDI